MRDITIPGLDMSQFKNAFVDSDNKIPEINDPNIDVSQFSNAFVEAPQATGTNPPQENSQPSFMEQMTTLANDTIRTPYQFARGAARSVGDLKDMGLKALAYGGKGLLRGLNAPQHLQEGANAMVREADNSHAGEQIGEMVDKNTGGRSVPNTTSGKIAETMGEFSVLPAAKTPKALLGAAGASTAIHATPKMAEEGTLSSMGEDVLKAVAGDALARKTLQPDTAKKLLDIAKHPIENTMARLFATGAKPNKEAIELAKEAGVTLPFNVQMDGKANNLLANTVFKSVFANKAWKEVLQNADKDMKTNFMDALDIGSKNIIGKEAASLEFKKELQAVKEAKEARRQELYAKAYEQPQQPETPHHLIQALDTLNNKLHSDISGTKKSFVKKKVLEIVKNLGLGSDNKKSNAIPIKDLSELGDEAVDRIYKAFQKSGFKKEKPIELSRLDQLRQDLGEITDYGTKPGVVKLLGSLTKAITKDVESSGSREFVNAWNEARNFHKAEIAETVRTDLAQSLLNGQFPKEAYSFMQSPRHVRELSRLVGNSPKAKEVMRDLKNVKLQEIMADKVLSNEGSKISYANLATLFEKKSGNQELFKELMGAANYQKMQKLSKISQAIVKSGVDLSNPSGSAVIAKDLVLIASLASPAAGAAVKTIASINLVSKAATNPKTLDRALKFAEQKMKAPQKDRKGSLLTGAMRSGLLNIPNMKENRDEN